MSPNYADDDQFILPDNHIDDAVSGQFSHEDIESNCMQIDASDRSSDSEIKNDRRPALCQSGNVLSRYLLAVVECY